MKPIVTFITPPSLFLLDERVFPALGILKVAAVVERLGYPVEHLDLNGVVNYEEAVLNRVRRVESRIFAVTGKASCRSRLLSLFDRRLQDDTDHRTVGLPFFVQFLYRARFGDVASDSHQAHQADCR